MEALFHVSGTHRWADGSNPMPLAGNPSQPSASEKQAQDNWRDTNSKANGLIHLSLTEPFRSDRYFSFAKTAHENFSCLKKFILNQALSHEAVLRRKVEDLSKESTESITDFYNRWLTVHEQYTAACGQTFPTLRQVECFIRSVKDPFYAPVIAQFSLESQIMNPMNPDRMISNPITLDYVYQRLQSYDAFGLRPDATSPSQHDSVSHAYDQDTRNDSRPASASNAAKPRSFSLSVICGNCGGYAHFRRDCPSPVRQRGDPLPPSLDYNRSQSQDSGNHNSPRAHSGGNRYSNNRQPRTRRLPCSTPPESPSFQDRSSDPDLANHLDDGWGDNSH
jgi:hypothetical protein